jgi:hypothetical protein
MSQTLPRGSVGGKTCIASNLDDDHANSVDVCRLVVTAGQNFRGNIFTVTFTVDIARRGPGASQAKVANLEDTFIIDEDVCWL